MASRFADLIRGTRLRKSTISDRDLETEMLSDKARIVTSTSFRRLQTKAQVFSLERNAAVRTRLTHTLEVAMYGELIAGKAFELLLAKDAIEQELRLPFILTVENACLLHDVGNPPFGHLGEFAIRDWFVRHEHDLKEHWRNSSIADLEVNAQFSGFEHFDGNPQGFRIVSHLQWLTAPWGLNLTCSLLATILKYLGITPHPDEPFRRKIGYFRTEAETVHEVWRSLGLPVSTDGLSQRHPLTFLMEAADDIAYCVSDIEDAIEKGILTENEFFDLIDEGAKNFAPGNLEPQSEYVAKNANYIQFRIGLTRYLVNAAAQAFCDHCASILDGSFNSSLLETDANANAALRALKSFAKTRIFVSREAVDIELSGFRVVQALLDGFSPLFFLPSERFAKLLPQAASDLRYGEMALERRLASLLPHKYLVAYKYSVQRAPALEPIFRAHLVVDNIAGMTDGHAVKVFGMLTGTSDGGRL